MASAFRLISKYLFHSIMSARSIKVKVVKETSSTVTIKLMSLNRKMPVPREDFEKRVKQGLYEVVGGEDVDADAE